MKFAGRFLALGKDDIISPSRVGLRWEYSRSLFFYRHWESRKSEFCTLMLLYFRQGRMSSLSVHQSLSGEWIFPNYPNNGLPKGGPLKKANSGSSTQTGDHWPCSCCSSVRTGHLLQDSNIITQRAIFLHDLLSDTHLVTAWEVADRYKEQTSFLFHILKWIPIFTE